MVLAWFVCQRLGRGCLSVRDMWVLNPKYMYVCWLFVSQSSCMSYVDFVLILEIYLLEFE